MISGTHPLSVGVVGKYSRSSANATVATADLVCFIGTETGSMTTHFWQVPAPGIRSIHIDIEPESIGRNYTPEVAIQGDALAVLQRMLTIEPSGIDEKRSSCAEAAVAADASWRDEYATLLSSDAVPIRPERVCAELTEFVPDDGIVVVDTGHAGMWMGGMYDIRTPGQSYIRSGGHLGWAFPAALGAKCGAPDRPVVCFTDVDFAALAGQIGAVGIRVESPGNIRPALDQALSADRPVIIDVVTDIDALAPLSVIG